MYQKEVTISSEEYKRLKEAEKVDTKLLAKIIKSFEDIKAGRIKKFC